MNNNRCKVCSKQTKSQYSIYCEAHHKTNRTWSMPYRPLVYGRHKDARHFNNVGRRIWRGLTANHQQVLIDAWQDRLDMFKSKEFNHQPPNHTNESVTRARLWNQYIAKRFEAGNIKEILERLVGFAYMIDHAPFIIRDKGKKAHWSYLVNKLIEPMPAVPLKQKTKGFGHKTTNVYPPATIRHQWGKWMEELAHTAVVLAGTKAVKEVETSSRKSQEAALRREQQRPRIPSNVYLWHNQAGHPFGLMFKTRKEAHWEPITSEVQAGCEAGKIKYEWANRCGVFT